MIKIKKLSFIINIVYKNKFSYHFLLCNFTIAINAARRNFFKILYKKYKDSS